MREPGVTLQVLSSIYGVLSLLNAVHSVDDHVNESNAEGVQEKYVLQGLWILKNYQTGHEQANKLNARKQDDVPPLGGLLKARNDHSIANYSIEYFEVPWKINKHHILLNFVSIQPVFFPQDLFQNHVNQHLEAIVDVDKGQVGKKRSVVSGKALQQTSRFGSDFLVFGKEWLLYFRHL